MRPLRSLLRAAEAGVARLPSRGQPSLSPASLDTAEPGLPFSRVPSPPALPLLGHMQLMAAHRLSFDRFLARLQAQHGDLVRLRLPGKQMLLLFNPEHFHVLSRHEPRIPISPPYDIFHYIRRTRLGAQYPTSGLINNQEDWSVVTQQKIFIML